MKKKTIAAILLSVAAGTVGGALIAGKAKSGMIQGAKEWSNKHLSLYLLMNQWLLTKQEGKSIVSYLKEKGYHTVAVYGMHYVGERLLDELEGSEIRVAYAVDRKAGQIFRQGVELKSPEDRLEKVDVMIVTPITYFEEIKEEMKEKLDCPILSIEDILYGL